MGRGLSEPRPPAVSSPCRLGGCCGAAPLLPTQPSACGRCCRVRRTLSRASFMHGGVKDPDVKILSRKACAAAISAFPHVSCQHAKTFAPLHVLRDAQKQHQDLQGSGVGFLVCVVSNGVEQQTLRRSTKTSFKKIFFSLIGPRCPQSRRLGRPGAGAPTSDLEITTQFVVALVEQNLLTVIALEMGRRWSIEAANFVRLLLGAGRGPSQPPAGPQPCFPSRCVGRPPSPSQLRGLSPLVYCRSRSVALPTLTGIPPSSARSWSIPPSLPPLQAASREGFRALPLRCPWTVLTSRKRCEGKIKNPPHFLVLAPPARPRGLLAAPGAKLLVFAVYSPLPRSDVKANLFTAPPRLLPHRHVRQRPLLLP